MILQEKGAEISRNYERIKNLALKMQKICPTEIKFFYRYGTFLQ